MDKLKQELLGAIKGYIDEIVRPYAQEVSQLKEKMHRLVNENNSLKEQVSSFQTIEVINGKDGCHGKDGKDFDIKIAKELLDMMFEPYRIKLDSIKNGIDGKDGRDGKDGYNGKDGKDFDPKVTKELLDVMFEPYRIKLDVIKDGSDGKDGYNGKDGKDFDPKVAKELLDVMFESYRIKLDSIKNGVDGKDGQDGQDGQDGKDGTNGKDGSSAFEIAKKHGYAGTELEFAKAQFGKDGRDGVDGKNGEKGLDGKDGLGFDDLKVDFDGERKVSLKFVAEGNIKEYSFSIPAQIYKGVYQKGHSYVIGDTVTDNGSLWSCVNPTSERPLSSESWQLAVKHGRAGDKGANGLTAYDLAIKNGFKGSEKEYLAEVRRGVRV